MVLATIIGSFAPSCAVLPANVPNMVLAGASETLYHLNIHYGAYLKLHFPVLGILKGVAIVILTSVVIMIVCVHRVAAHTDCWASHVSRHR